MECSSSFIYDFRLASFLYFIVTWYMWGGDGAQRLCMGVCLGKVHKGEGERVHGGLENTMHGGCGKTMHGNTVTLPTPAHHDCLTPDTAATPLPAQAPPPHLACTRDTATSHPHAQGSDTAITTHRNDTATPDTASTITPRTAAIPLPVQATA